MAFYVDRLDEDGQADFKGKAKVFLKDDTQVYKQFVENESFNRFVGDMVYAMTNP